MKYNTAIFDHFISLLRGNKYYVLIFLFSILLGLSLGNLNFKISDSHIDLNNEISEHTGSGLGIEAWDFVRKFDKPLLKTKDFDLPLDEVRKLIKQDLQEEFKNNLNIINERFDGLSSSETFISFLTLKSGLSLPVLESAKNLKEVIAMFLVQKQETVITMPTGWLFY